MYEWVNWYEETETPSSWEDGRCVHNGLFADDGPLWRTHHCTHCGQDVPNREL